MSNIIQSQRQKIIDKPIGRSQGSQSPSSPVIEYDDQEKKMDRYRSLHNHSARDASQMSAEYMSDALDENRRFLEYQERRRRLKNFDKNVTKLYGIFGAIKVVKTLKSKVSPNLHENNLNMSDQK